MGKPQQRKKGRRRRSEAAKLAARYFEQGLEREVDDALEYQESKKNHKDYAGDIARREQELLSRTVFVSNLKDLRRYPCNLALLEQFFESRYGPVEMCIEAKYFGRQWRHSRSFPKARVRFRHVGDAQRIFGGKKLLDVQRYQDPPVEIPNSEVGHRGCLRVQPSTLYPGMDASLLDNVVRILCDGLRLGHWFPSGDAARDDGCFQEEGNNLFLVEDAVHNAGVCSIEIDTRTIQFRLQSADCMLSFRFKDLRGTMDVVFDRQSSTYSLVFRLKYPPRIYRISRVPDRDGIMEEVTDRCLAMGEIRSEVFGSCFAYMLNTSRHNLSILFGDKKKLKKLKQFGVLPRDGVLSRDLYSVGDAQSISTRKVDSCKDKVDFALRCIADRSTGLMLRSLLDNGRFCRYHALYDKALYLDGELNIFELVESVPSAKARRVLDKMAAVTWPTQHPAASFKALLSLDIEETWEEDQDTFAFPEYCTRTPRLLITPTRVSVAGFSIEMSNRVVRHFVSNEDSEPESFLRVSIGEENGSRLFSDQLSRDVCCRIKQLVLQGLLINGRDYKFLAYSSSQLKESSLWMVQETDKWNVCSIRSWMGDFTMCETASKVAARMGQCFSTTVVASEAHSSHSLVTPMDRFPDVNSVHNGKKMCHSDGTGIIERIELESLVGRLPIGPKDNTEVSMIQIRYGGAKGTLAAWDIRDLVAQGTLPRDPGECTVLLRPSMVKFKAPYDHLEVISIGKQVPYYLNRNVILLLRVHGIPDRVFLEMQRKMLNDMDAMLTDRLKAMQLIPRLGGPDGSMSSILVYMLSCGLSPRDDPFLFSCIHAIIAHHRTTLRKKSRVFVEKGAVLLGGLDETGLLPEGCVFLQIRPGGASPERNADLDDSGFQILTGPVMVTKHPVMHPGDVRMLLAVDIPELRHQKNCILFSQHGTRPEADKMAGSDLDGDQFAVTWDKSLFLGEWNGCTKLRSGEWRSSHGARLLMKGCSMARDAKLLQTANHEPMDFDPDSILSGNHDIDPLATAVSAILGGAFGISTDESENAVDDEKLIAHFINHARNDNLGQISKMWLDYANGTNAACEECLRLAGLHSIAVDFPKSGKPAIIPKELLIPRSTPRAHWREKKDSPSYTCTGPLGQMYDEVVKRGNQDISDNALPLAGRKFDRSGQILRFVQSPRVAMSLLEKIFKPHVADRLGLDLHLQAVTQPDWGDSRSLGLIDEALAHRDEYETALVRIMSKYGVQCEGELLTGCIRKYHKLDKKRQHDLSETVRSQCRELRSNHRRIFFSFVLYDVCPQLEEIDADDEMEALWLDCIEAAATCKEIPRGHSFSSQQFAQFVTLSRKLAAAYYVATYNPEFQWENATLSTGKRSLLFSFPWIVADVIATGLRN